MGTLTGRLVASRKSVIRLRWMIWGCTGRTSRTEEESTEGKRTLEHGELRELLLEEVEVEVEEEKEQEVEGRRKGRRRKSSMS